MKYELKITDEHGNDFIADVSKRNCDNCENKFDQDGMRFLDDDWWLCEDCFQKGSVGDCEYSSYCNYTSTCDYAC